MSSYPLTSKDTTRVELCPKCGSRDIKGPFDSLPTAGAFLITRAWYCRACWWDRELRLKDDIALAKAETAKREAKGTHTPLRP